MAETTDVQRLLVSLEASLKKYENEMRRAGSIADKEVGNVEKRLAAGSKNIGNSTANLAAQFQDIAVQLQGGSSPLTVALQQGTQINQVIGRAGAAGAVSLLAGAFASLLNPVSLVTIGVIALGGAAIQWLTSASSGVKSLDDLLEEHGQLIKGLKDSYGEAGDGLDKLVRQNSSVIEALIRTSIVALQEQYKKLANDAATSMSTIIAATDQMGNATGAVDEQAAGKFIRFKDAIDAFRESARSGVPDVRTFRAAVAEVEKSDADPKVKKLAAELLELTKDADRASDGLTAAQRAIAETGRIASGEVGRVKEFRDALADLAKIGLPKLDDRAKALEAFQRALSGAGGNVGAIRGAEAEYLASVTRIGQREKEEADKQAAEDAKRLADRNARRAASNERSFLQDMENVRKSTEVLNLEFEMMGKTNQERDRARILLQLEAEARKRNITLTEEQRAQATQLADAYAAAAERSRQAGQIVSEVRDFGAAASEAFKGLVLEGKKVDDVLKTLLSRLASRGIDRLFDGLFTGLGNSIAGGGGGGLGSFFSSLLGSGRAAGGPVDAGVPIPVGERGREIFVPSSPGRIIPNDMIRPRTEGGTFAPVYQIDASGADAGTVARIERVLSMHAKAIESQGKTLVSARRMQQTGVG